MQTFLPYPSYTLSARYLDYRRLGKQRSESMILIKTLLGEYEKEGRSGWPNHPATKMWRGHEYHLVLYSIEMAKEWRARGHSDTTLEWFQQKEEQLRHTAQTGSPSWLGDYTVHESHQSNLLEKEPEYYEQFDWTVEPGMPYVWPVPNGKPGDFLDIFSTYYEPVARRGTTVSDMFGFKEADGEQMRMFRLPTRAFFEWAATRGP